MDVFITILCLKGAGSPLLGYNFKASFNLGKFRGCENARFLVCSGEGNTSVNVLEPETSIIGKRFVVLDEERILAT